jgi:hypothetical protein
MYRAAREMTILYLLAAPSSISRLRGWFPDGKAGPSGSPKEKGATSKCKDTYKFLCFSQLNRFTYQFPFRGL